MRWLPTVLAAVLMAGCAEEPTFDERYAETQKRIGEKSKELDRELAGQPAAEEGEAAAE